MYPFTITELQNLLALQSFNIFPRTSDSFEIVNFSDFEFNLPLVQEDLVYFPTLPKIQDKSSLSYSLTF